MGSDATLRIPAVDLSDANLKPGTHAWAAARAQVSAALESYGCFEAAHGGVTPELREAAIGAAKELFALPVEAKRRNASDRTYRGYIGQVPGYPYESLAIDDALDPAAVPGFTHLMWPEGNSTFCETARGFLEKAAELDGMVRRMVLESLGVENHFDSHMGLTKYDLRFSEYAPPGAGPGGEEEQPQVVLPTHVDLYMSTLIYQLNPVHGLEVQTRSGEWVPFAPSCQNSVVFLAGDAFRAWSNDRLYSPQHRVRVLAGGTRYSIMLFAVPGDEVLVEAPRELAGDGRPRRFRPYRHPEYVQFFKATRYATADLKSILPAFCGTANKEGGRGEQTVVQT